MYKTFENQSVGKPPEIYICLLLIYSSLSFVYFIAGYGEELVWGHSFFGDGGNTLLNATQTQQNENYVVDLFVDPSIPSVDRHVNFTLEIKSKTNDVLIELPVAVYFLKDGKPVYSNPNNYTLVRQQHYDFGYKFSEPGVYSLIVNIKDIFIHSMLLVLHLKLW
ncbi:hypothetical protein [Candidatus Nitrosocosmicus hydrocola]|uniref:hypothetical protein n=1 Tax=Candidatus Nitrosocosmicus hydrocola TaxID=1826872 RepID=UPI0011E59652|nr:hypothetical protein [Candidatus Nitrosocosmicus hydrocola]